MSSIAYTILSTELTSIPSSIKTILGTNFNNTLCNGVTWLFITWLLLHFCYQKIMHEYLKQLGFTQYLRTRLSNSLWLLAFFLSFFVYYLVTLDEYTHLKELVNFKRVILPQYGDVASHKSLAQALICSFYLFMGLSQGIELSSLHSLSKFIALTVVCSTAYILRFLEIPFTLTALVAISGIFEELAKMFYSLLNRENKLCDIFIRSVFISSVVLFVTVYLAIIPLSFLIPLGTRLFRENPNFLVVILFGSLLCWLNLVLYKSLLLNSMFHWLYHQIETNEEEENQSKKHIIQLDCLGNMIECSLFPPRTDDGYMIAFYRAEAKKREKKMLARRKPKNRTMIVQTLKCMMAIKKKLSEKRAANSDSDESDENDDESEEENLITSNAKEETDVDIEKEPTNFGVMKKSGNIIKFPHQTEQENHSHNNQEEVEIKNIHTEDNSNDPENEMQDNGGPNCQMLIDNENACAVSETNKIRDNNKKCKIPVCITKNVKKEMLGNNQNLN